MMKFNLKPRKLFLALALLSLPFASHYLAEVARSAVCDQKVPESPAPLCGEAQPACEGLNQGLCPLQVDWCETTGVYREKVPKDCVPSGVPCQTEKIVCVWADDAALCWQALTCVWDGDAGEDGLCVAALNNMGNPLVCWQAFDSFRKKSNNCNCPGTY